MTESQTQTDDATQAESETVIDSYESAMDAARSGALAEGDEITVRYVNTQDEEDDETGVVESVRIEEAGERTDGRGRVLYTVDDPYAVVEYDAGAKHLHEIAFCKDSVPEVTTQAREGVDRTMGDVFEVRVDDSAAEEGGEITIEGLERVRSVDAIVDHTAYLLSRQDDPLADEFLAVQKKAINAQKPALGRDAEIDRDEVALTLSGDDAQRFYEACEYAVESEDVWGAEIRLEHAREFYERLGGTLPEDRTRAQVDPTVDEVVADDDGEDVDRGDGIETDGGQDAAQPTLTVETNGMARINGDDVGEGAHTVSAPVEIVTDSHVFQIRAGDDAEADADDPSEDDRLNDAESYDLVSGRWVEWGAMSRHPNTKAVKPWILRVTGTDSKYGFDGDWLDKRTIDGSHHMDASDLAAGDFIRVSGASHSNKKHRLCRVLAVEDDTLYVEGVSEAEVIEAVESDPADDQEDNDE